MSDIELLRLTAEIAQRIRVEVGKTVVGQDDVLESMLIALVSGGHALLVGVPGLAKTLLVSSLAKALSLTFGRVQFTPDLLPADITGTDVLHEQEGQRGLRFMPGPIFHNLVLADEINRTPPKTQAALLQAMQEREVTVGSHTHALPRPFQVFATRNPIEQEGTYALPEAQRDRFLLEILVDYPGREQELEIARRTTSGPAAPIEAVVEQEQLQAILGLIPRIPITEQALELAVNYARATRPGGAQAPEMVKKYVRYGAGPRGSQALVLAAKGRAAVRGEAAADLQDVQAMLLPTLRHRLVLSYRADADHIASEVVLEALAKAVG